MKEGVDLIMWDWSGTLSDDRRPVHAANSLMCEHYGIPPVLDFDEWLRSTNRGPQEFFQERGVADSHDRMQEIYKSCYSRVVAGGIRPTMYQGVPEVLSALRDRGKKQVVISAHPEAHLHQEAKDYGIFDYFHQMTGDVRDKSLAIIGIAEELKIPPQRTVYIGDMFSDVVLAKKAGVHSVALTWGYHSEGVLAPHNPTRIWPHILHAHQEIF